jgi:major intracellular serine protease
MKPSKLLTVLFAVFLLAAAATAAEPIKIKLPMSKPRVLDSFVKSDGQPDPNVAWLNVPAAWKLTRGEGVVFHCGDTGCDATHPELQGVTVEKRNYTTDGPDDKGQHGTHVITTVVGQKEVTGIAPRVKKVVAHKVLGDGGSGDFAWMEKSIYAAMKEPGVYNGSLGSDPTAEDPRTFAPGLLTAIRAGIDAGMIFVFAAGNAGPGDDTCGFPARYGEVVPDLVVVAAADHRTEFVADFSSRGKSVFTVAPGVGIVSALPGKRYAAWDGTSMGSPHIAGLACLWLSANPDVPKSERQKRFAAWLRSASRFPDERHPARGYGRPDASKLTASKPTDPPKPTPGEKVYVVDVAKLRADGYTSVRFDLGTTTVGQAPPVATFTPQYQPAPVVVYHTQPQPVQTWSYAPAPVYSPPPPVVYYHQTPATCGPGGCRPPPVWQPFGGRFR